MKKFLKLAFCSILSFVLSPCLGIANAKDLTLVLDPGHGGPHPGCVYTYNGKEVIESCTASPLCADHRILFEMYALDRERVDVVTHCFGNNAILTVNVDVPDALHLSVFDGNYATKPLDEMSTSRAVMLCVGDVDFVCAIGKTFKICLPEPIFVIGNFKQYA